MLYVLAVVAAAWLLRAADQLLIPIVLAALISFALQPLVAWMVARRIPRAAATSLVLLSIAGLLGWGAVALRDDVVEGLEALPTAIQRARDLLASQITQVAPEATGVLKNSSGPAPQVIDLVQQAIGSGFTLLADLVVVFFLVFFFLITSELLRGRVIEIAGPNPERRQVAATILDDVNRRVQRFLFVRVLTAALVGAATWGVLAWMDVAQAALWGVLAGIFNSIPYFGPIIVSGGLLVVGLVQGGSLVRAMQMASATLVITSLEGWLITPPLIGKAERMNAVAVFLGLLIWTWLWGPWGTLLAVPMLVLIKAFADQVDWLQSLARLMDS